MTSGAGHTAVPAAIIDLIRDGVPQADLRRHGGAAVEAALGRTALSALNHGWTRPEWEFEVMRAKSNLGQQVRVQTDERERTPKARARMLNRAWDRAEKCATESPAWDTPAAAREAAERAEGVRLIAADADAPITDTARKVLIYAAERAEVTGSTVVNLPRAATAQALGVTARTVEYALLQLSRDGRVLCLTEHGRPAGPRSKRPPKANAYSLPTPAAAHAYLGRLRRQVAHDHMTGSTQPDAALCTQHMTGSTQQPDPPSKTEETEMASSITAHYTLTEEEVEVALEAVRRLRRQKAAVEGPGLRLVASANRDSDGGTGVGGAE